MKAPQPILCRRCLDRADLGFVRPRYTAPVCVVPMPDFSRALPDRYAIEERPTIREGTGITLLYVTSGDMSVADRLVGYFRTRAEALAEERKRNAQAMAGWKPGMRQPVLYFVEEIGAACAAVREDGKRMFMRVSQ